MSDAVCAAGLVGRRINDVLDELRQQGLTFIYNDEIVSDALRVTTEPNAVSGEALAREILAPYELTLDEVAPRTFTVVRVQRSAREQRSAVARTGNRPTLEEVVVQTSRYALAADLSGSHAFLDQVQVTNLPRLGDETLHAVQRLPGAAVNGFSSIGPIRGGVPNETAILLDGLRLYEPFHLKNYLSPVSLLDSRLIDGLDVYFGGFPAPYGHRMSAIVDARSVRPETDRYYEIGLTLFHVNAVVATSLDDDRGQLLLSARRSNLGELSSLAENDIGKPEYSDGFARLDWQFSETTTGALHALLSHDRVTAVRSSGTERAQDESSNGYLWGTLSHAWSDSLSSRAILSWTSVSDERHGAVSDPGRRTGEVRDDRSFGVIGLRLENEWRTAPASHRFGAEVRRLWAEYEYRADVRFDADYPFPGSPPTATLRDLELHPDGYEASGYWDARLQPNNLWTMEVGLRVDTQTYDGSGDSAQWSPRINLLYNAGPKTRLRASWGRFYQSQGINELQIEDGVDRFYPAQHANHAILSIEHSFSSGLDARLELYRKD
ncbi:TonB-dependent receptor plug domain-containing protein, partial [Povalibacter sp.]|uniref:TonB-dependent receptor plug domain-containing protein n=1 Tax=Povalibacter sp. TaxID=1962978 RepID=UPI002F3E2F6B